MSRQIGLAAQAVPGLSPSHTVEVAAAAGFDRVGIAVDPADWSAATTRAVRGALRSTGLYLHDVEVIRLGYDSRPDVARLIDIAAEIGTPFVIAISLIDDPDRTRDLLAEARAHGAGARVVPILEFGRFTSVATVEQASALAQAAGVPILLDPLHLARSGAMASAITGLPAAMLPYAQICGAGPPPPDADGPRLLLEAREERRDLGHGELDLAGFVAALPAGVPLMNEVRSAALARAIADPLARARHLAATMRSWLGQWEEQR